MNIGIDIDNTIVNTAETVVNYINERLPLHLELSDIKQYWMENSLPKQFQWIVEAAFRDRFMWKDVKMISGAYDNIKRLYHDRHTLWFVTSASPENLKKKIGHLTRELDFLPADYVEKHTINIQKKQMLQLDIMIDDYIENLNGPRTYTSICLAYPWNYRLDDPDFYYVKDWQEIYSTCQIVSELHKE